MLNISIPLDTSKFTEVVFFLDAKFSFKGSVDMEYANLYSLSNGIIRVLTDKLPPAHVILDAFDMMRFTYPSRLLS